MLVTVRHTSTMPSEMFIRHQTYLAGIAAFAKALNQMELFNQAKEMHNNMARQYNDQSTPKKGFWQQFKDNLSLNMNTHTDTWVSYLEDDWTYKDFCEQAQKMTRFELQKQLSDAINSFNKWFGN